ncbi:MAG TPA: RNA polymerase sigma factor [Dehalococcoidia bacterium]|jgi:RNA polymerase sigma-70 factor (ECF subfamily)|nr:RNA polymerase sigma factor [Dehalococcoidia bacterium]
MLQTAGRSNLGLSGSSAGAAAEEDLVKRAQALDEGALGALFDAYYPKLLNYGLLQFRDVQAAEDLASDVILRVLESIPSYRTRGVPLSAWVFRIARNRLVDIRRRVNRRREVGLGDSFDATTATAPQTAVERTLDYGQLCAALSQLTAVQEQVIILRFFKDLDVATVARIVGRSPSAVKSLQFRGLLALRRILEGQEPESRPAIAARQPNSERFAVA